MGHTPNVLLDFYSFLAKLVHFCLGGATLHPLPPNCGQVLGCQYQSPYRPNGGAASPDTRLSERQEKSKKSCPAVFSLKSWINMFNVDNNTLYDWISKRCITFVSFICSYFFKIFLCKTFSEESKVYKRLTKFLCRANILLFATVFLASVTKSYPQLEKKY